WTKEKLIEWQQQTGTKTGAVYTASYYTVFDRFKTLREAAGVSEGCTLQSLRRLNIRTARQAGVPADVLAKCAGHTIAVSTKHYADLDALNAGEHLNKISYA
ncbi:MAG TPA: hypothetical protein VEK08_05695, partial [Planctomycetota bacterium]|nr:hypothetical protein [Planctomycetota bacterium]